MYHRSLSHKKNTKHELQIIMKPKYPTSFRIHAADNVETLAAVVCLKKQVVKRLGTTLPLSAAILEKKPRNLGRRV